MLPFRVSPWTAPEPCLLSASAPRPRNVENLSRGGSDVTKVMTLHNKGLTSQNRRENLAVNLFELDILNL